MDLPLPIPGFLLIGLSLLAVLGLVGWLGIWRLKNHHHSELPEEIPLSLDLIRHTEAFLLVQRGGIVRYINPTAREMFHVGESAVHLERLARKTRPSEVFLSLCAGEGRGRFTLDGRLIEGASYQIPYGNSWGTLVTLHRTQIVRVDSSDEEEGTALSHQDLSTLTDILQTMTVRLDSEGTMSAIMQGLGRLFPFDLSFIALWDENLQAWVPYSWVTEGRESRLRKLPPLFATDRQAADSLLFKRTGFLFGNNPAESKPFILPAVDLDAFQSILGVPLFAGNEYLGTLCFASLLSHCYTNEDLELLTLIAGLAANSLRLSLQYEAQQRRLTELNGLVQLAESINALQDTHDLFSRWVESFAPLLNVEVLGFLLYDENRHILEAQQPFMGIPSSALEWARFTIQPGGQAEQILLSGERLLSSDAPTDPAFQALGLHHIAQAAGLKHVLLQPLSTTGKILGYILAADKKDGGAFLEDDFRILALIATQTASFIENVRLIQQSRRRALMAETLRRITNLAGSSATLDEILEYAVLDLARLFACDVGAVFLLDETHGELRLHKPSLYGIEPPIATLMSRLSTDDVQFQQTVTSTQKMIHSGNSLEDTAVLPIYHVWVGPLQLDSILAVPLIVREQSIGEIMFGSQKADFFSPLDVQTVVTAAGQLAGAIERAILYTQTDESLRRRVDQLVALTQLSRELNSTKDLDYLIERVYEEALNTTKADCGTILLFAFGEPVSSPESEPRIIFYLGEPPSPQLRPEERWVLQNSEALVIDDYQHPKGDALSLVGVNRENVLPLEPAHPEIRSALIVPIAFQEQIVGLIHLHGREAGLFDLTAREIAESLAIQAAVAIGNAQRYQEEVRRNEMLAQRVDTLAKLFEISQSLQLELPVDKALENIAYAIQTATPFNAVKISIYHPENSALHPIAGAGVASEEIEDVEENRLPWETIQPYLREAYRIGRAYFIPAEERFRPPEEAHVETTQTDELPLRPSRYSWHPQDMFFLPLFTSSGQPSGLIVLDKPRDNLRPERATVMSLEIFASQAGLVIESHSRIDALSQHIHELEIALDQARQVGMALREQLLQQVESELADDTQAQRYRLLGKRVTSTLQIGADLVNYTDRLPILQAMGNGIIEKLGFQLVLLAEPVAGGLHLLEVFGETDISTPLEPLLGQRNPLLTCLRSRTGEFVASLEMNSGWKDSPLLNALQAKGFICLPILPQNGVEAALLAVSYEPMLPFLPEDEQIFELLQRQAAAAIQHANLLEEINRQIQEVSFLMDFSRQLSSLEPTHILDTLLQSLLHMLPMAEAGMVALFDSRQQLLLPQAVAGYSDNDAIRQIGYSPGNSLIGKTFSHGEAVIIKDLDFAANYQLSAQDLAAYRKGTNGRLPISCLVYPLKSSPQMPAIGVLVLDNFNFPSAFRADDLAFVASLAQQATLHLENSRLFQASRQRASQLQALTDVATVITTKLQPQELVASLLDELGSITTYDTATLWLRQADQMMVAAVRGFEDEDQRLGLTVALEDSQLLMEMIRNGQPINVPNTHLDPRFPKLPDQKPASWLGLPLNVGGEVRGVIALEKFEPYAYTAENMQIAMTFAAQAAIAMENAQLYQETVTRAAELSERTQRLAMLNRLSMEFSKTLEPQRILEITLDELLHITAGKGALTLLFDEDHHPILAAEKPVCSLDSTPHIPEAPIFNRLRETFGVFHSEDISQEDEFAPLRELLELRRARSVLALALATADELHGVILIYDDANQRFPVDQVELARTVANQAAIALQNARLYAETLSLTQDLEKRVQDRTAQLALEHRRTEILLRITTELTASLDLEHVLNRTIRILNEMVDAEQITVMIIRPGEDRLYHLASYGYAPPPPVRGRTSPFRNDEGLAGWVIQSRQSVLIGNVRNDPRWVQLPAQPSDHRSAIGVPMMIGEEAIGALLFFHRQENYFSAEQLDLIQAAANQVAIAVNNAELYRLIRDQAEDLGTMFRNQQIETSRSQAILEAVADGVLVTDASGKITLFNASAERILNLPRAQVMGKSLEQFSGLFGRAAQRWTHTIQAWSRENAAYQDEEVYSEQIELDTGKVVSVNLAPVRLRDDFLGTVSVFRDITHQVELDRLKSEFVATVSHELRTPMTSIKGYVEVLLMGAAGALSEQQARFLEIIRSNTERLAALVNDLLDISRIEAGKSSLSLQPLNLLDLAQQALDSIQQRSRRENKPMRFELESPTKLPLVLGDAERVIQILDNLLENAYQYSEPDRNVRLCIIPRLHEVQIDVVDQGVGIPAALQERVFERFYRGENPHVLASYGTGLGLSIVKNLVEMHRGKIWVESSGVAGEGSTFSFTLPVYSLEESPLPDLAGEERWQRS
jgi:PAS domain S-box-containing protein